MNEAQPAGANPAPKPADPVVIPARPRITREQFQAVDLRAGKVLDAKAHPNADRLLVLSVDVGEETPRQIVAGIRADHAPETLVGRVIIVVANLEPAVLRGVESQGMLLAVRGVDKVLPLGLDGAVVPGTPVT